MRKFNRRRIEGAIEAVFTAVTIIIIAAAVSAAGYVLGTIMHERTLTERPAKQAETIINASAPVVQLAQLCTMQTAEEPPP